MCPGVDSGVLGISPGIKAAYVKKIRGLNLPGTPWACPGLLRETFTFFYFIFTRRLKIKREIAACNISKKISSWLINLIS